VPSPDEAKPMASLADYRNLDPKQVREALGDGSFGGRYFRSDEEMQALWEVAVEETRQLLTSDW
jgi:creatinine amidohydrolase